MNDPLLNQLVQMVNNANWPASQRTGMQTRRIYERGLDEVNAFSGDPRSYANALGIFQRTDSCPYAYAGIAYTLAHASWLNDKVDAQGITEAIHWLEKAQEWEADRIEINFIEAFIYIISKDLQNGRAVLDYLGRQNPQYYHYCLMEMLYHRYGNRLSGHNTWFEKALNAAQTPPQQAYACALAGNYYLKLGRYDQSIGLFKEVVKIKPDDAWAWHNMSVMLMSMDNYDDASLCNQKALSIMDFGAARSVEQRLEKYKKMGGSRLGRLFKR